MRMRTALRLLAAAVVMAALLPGTAAATHVPDQSSKMAELFTSPNQAVNSDFAFWGKYAFAGYYTGDAGVPAGTPPPRGGRLRAPRPAAPRRGTDLRHLDPRRSEAGQGRGMRRPAGRPDRLGPQ